MKNLTVMMQYEALEVIITPFVQCCCTELIVCNTLYQHMTWQSSMSQLSRLWCRVCQAQSLHCSTVKHPAGSIICTPLFDPQMYWIIARIKKKVHISEALSLNINHCALRVLQEIHYFLQANSSVSVCTLGSK